MLMHSYVVLIIRITYLECEEVVNKTTERTLASSLATGNDQTASKKDLPSSSGVLRHTYMTHFQSMICNYYAILSWDIHVYLFHIHTYVLDISIYVLVTTCPHVAKSHLVQQIIIIFVNLENHGTYECNCMFIIFIISHV